MITENVLIKDNKCLVLWIGLRYAALVFPAFYISWLYDTFFIILFSNETCNRHNIYLHI